MMHLEDEMSIRIGLNIFSDNDLVRIKNTYISKIEKELNKRQYVHTLDDNVTLMYLSDTLGRLIWYMEYVRDFSKTKEELLRFFSNNSFVTKHIEYGFDYCKKLYPCSIKSNF